MSPPAAGTARALRGAPSRRAAAPASIPRRRSGPAGAAGPAALPKRPAPPARRRRAERERARRYGPGAVVLDGLMRGNSWVVLVGVLLAGIVFLSVSVLELNQGIASTTSSAQALEQSNSLLRSKLAAVQSPEAIQRRAEALGFVLPQPNDIVYLPVDRARDANAAAARLASGAASSSGQATEGAAGAGAPQTPSAAAPAPSSAAPSAAAPAAQAASVATPSPSPAASAASSGPTSASAPTG